MHVFLILFGSEKKNHGLRWLLFFSFVSYRHTHTFLFMWLLVAAIIFRAILRLFCCAIIFFSFLSVFLYICLNLTQFVFPLSHTRPLSFLFTHSLCVPVSNALHLFHMQTNTHTHNFVLFCFATTAWVCFGYFLCVCVWFVSFHFIRFVLWHYLFVPFGIIIGFLSSVCSHFYVYITFVRT